MLVRSFAKVIQIPAMFKLGLIELRIIATVFVTLVIHLAGRYCACTGIKTSVDAARALIVKIPRAGGQSIKI